MKSRGVATNLKSLKCNVCRNVHRKACAKGILVHQNQPCRHSHRPLQRQWFSTEASSSERPSEISIVEVGPRDGLQNESQIVSVDDKIKLIEMLIHAGCRRIEVGAMVHPKLVPNMANSLEVMQKLYPLKADDIHFSCLIPKSKYLDAIKDTPVDEIAIFASATETFSQKNLNCSIEESMLRFRDILSATSLDGQLKVRGYLSCTIACPYEGPTDPKVVGRYTEELLKLGCHEVSVADTIGVGTPETTNVMLQSALVATGGNPDQLAVHFHDTYGNALRNIFVSLDHGIRVVDASVAGLGGCPFAKGATGNVATEDVVSTLHGLGVETGIDLEELKRASSFIRQVLGKSPRPKASA